MRILLAAMLMLAAACDSAVPSGAPPVGAAPAGPVRITDATRGEVETALNKRLDALRRKDLTGFQSTVDLTRPAFRRCQQEAFEVASRQGVPTAAVKVAKVEPYGDGYVRAYAGTDENGYSRVYLRQEAGAWKQTEPKDDELGGDKSKTVGGLQLSYYGIDEDVIDIYGRAGVGVRDFLEKVAAGRTKAGIPFGLRIFPTRGAAGPTVACSVAGFHLTNNPDPFIRIFTNALSFKPGLAEVSETTASIIRHEGLHWLQGTFITGIEARLDWWLVEGWPDYIGESRAANVKRQVVCNTPTPTFKQLVDGLTITPETPTELPGQYYAFANTMIEYVYKTFGDNAYWDLMTVYKDGVDPNVNYPKVLKVTPTEFYSGWLAWVKRTYC